MMSKVPADHVQGLSGSSVSALLALGVIGSERHEHRDHRAIDLHAVLGQTSRRVLRIVLTDLRQPVLTTTDGPLSFERIAEPDQRVLESLKGKSFLDALVTMASDAEAMKALARYSRAMLSPSLPESTRLCGTVIHTLACAALETNPGGADPRPTASAEILKSLGDFARGR